MRPTSNDNLRKISEAILYTIEKKNQAYGNAFAEAYAEIGPMYAVGKIFEKYKRINTLSKANDISTEESLDDSLMDIIGYSLLYLDQRQQKNGEH